MLTGNLPFHGQNRKETMTLILKWVFSLELFFAIVISPHLLLAREISGEGYEFAMKSALLSTTDVYFILLYIDFRWGYTKLGPYREDAIDLTPFFF